jgi:hypothetical protein
MGDQCSGGAFGAFLGFPGSFSSGVIAPFLIHLPRRGFAT